MVEHQQQSSGGSSGSSFKWYIIFIFGTIFQSIALIYWQRVKKLDNGAEVHWLVGTCLQSFAGVLLGIIPSLTWDYFAPYDPRFAPHFGFFANFLHWQGILVFFWLSIASGVIAFAGYYYLMEKIGDLAATVTYGFPVVGLIEGVLFRAEWSGFLWYEKLSQIIGCLLVVAGLVFTTRNPPPAPAAKK